MLPGVIGVGQELRAKLKQALLEESELRLVHVFLVGRFQKILLAQLPLFLDLFHGTLRGHGFGSGGFAADAFGRDIFGCYTFGCHAITFLQRVFLLNFSNDALRWCWTKALVRSLRRCLPRVRRLNRRPAASNRALYLEWLDTSHRRQPATKRMHARRRLPCAPYNAKKQAVCGTFPCCFND